MGKKIRSAKKGTQRTGKADNNKREEERDFEKSQNFRRYWKALTEWKDSLERSLTLCKLPL